MTARPDITKSENMLEVQGDRVSVYRYREDHVPDKVWVLTLVHVISEAGHEMRMSNREAKDRKPDWPFTQAYYDKLRPAPPGNKENAKWEITLKIK